MLTSKDQSTIKAWNRSIGSERSIYLTLPDDPRSSEFQEFCDDLAREVPGLRVVRENEDEPDMPTIRIGKNIRYQALPLENELAPFLDALVDASEGKEQLADTVRDLLESVEIPAFLKVFVSSQCPFCPSTVRRLLQIAGANESVKLTVIDAFMFPEKTEPHNILSTPTVLLDDLFRWTGAIDPYEIVDMIVNRDPSKLSAASLKDMVDEGNAVGVARMMIDNKKIFPAFIDLLSHTKWPVRLGAMVAYETLIEEDQSLAVQVVDPLWKRFTESDDRVKGDILYVLGESGHKSLAPRLRDIQKGAHPDEVKEAAAEALEKIESPL
jgi:thiol-disulfide isomerase/thioredoxin